MNSTPKTSSGLPESIVFYCKDCHAIRDVKRLGRRYVYTCATCNTKNVAFGTIHSIGRYFRVKEEEEEENETEGETPSEENTDKKE